MYKGYKTVDVCNGLELKKKDRRAIVLSCGKLVDKGTEYIVGRRWLNFKAIAMRGG